MTVKAMTVEEERQVTVEEERPVTVEASESRGGETSQ